MWNHDQKYNVIITKLTKILRALVPYFAFCVSATTRMSALNLNIKSISLSVSRRNLRIGKDRSDTLEYLDLVNIHRKLGFKGPG